MIRSSPRRGIHRFLAVALAACALIGQPSLARAQVFRAFGEGLGVGRFILYPSVSFEYTEDDNVFYVSDDRSGSDLIQSGVVVIKPRIMVDLPLGTSRLRWVYSPTYRDYTTNRFQTTNRFSHFFDLEGAFQLGPALRIGVREHFVRGTIELQEVDPGGEITFGLTPFVTHSPEMDVTVDLGTRTGVSLIPRYATVRFDDLAAATFFSYRRRELEVRLNYRVTQPTTIYVFHTSERTDQNREQDILGEIDQDARVIGIGLRRMVNEDVTTQFAAAYRTTRFEGGVGNTNFSGPVVDASAAWQLNDSTRIAFSASRQVNQSFFVNNNYYVNSEVRLRLTKQLGLHLFCDAGASYGGSLYDNPVDSSIGNFQALMPSDGLRRRDRSARVEIGAGYHILRTVRVFAGYSSGRRDSNIVQCGIDDTTDECIPGSNFEPFDYRVNRLFIRMEAGWF